MAIDKHCYISVRKLPPFFPHRYRIVYSKIEQVVDLSEIQHPAVKAILEEWQPQAGLEINYHGDLPARSGIASSSAFTVGLLNALNCARGNLLDKKTLASEAMRIERDVLQENVGSQDQVWAAHGGFNTITFEPSGEVQVSPVVIPQERRDELMGSWMLFFTGLSRYSTVLAGKQIANLSQRTAQLHEMRRMVDEASGILTAPEADLKDIGRLLHESWQLKRELAEGISTPALDDIYSAARAGGALGGKILGAGGGGFMLFYVEPDKKEAVRRNLSSLVEVDFAVDHSGSSVVVYHPDDLGAP